jgi:glycosyltransferase involved in cell wall biosynthesis
VVIPAHDEATRLGRCLESLVPFLLAGDPVVVVDACSADATAEVAARAGAVVLRSPSRDRGLALARGYETAAQHVAAVFLVHADMEVPADARRRILGVLARAPEAVGGVLGHRILDERWRFRFIEAGNRFRARRWQLPYGDQAQFVRTEAVARAGGFPAQSDMEDLELSLRLRALGPWVYLDCPVSIPSRHWRDGVVRTTVRNWIRALSYRAGRGRPGAREAEVQAPEA